MFSWEESRGSVLQRGLRGMVEPFVIEQFVDAIDTCRKYCVDHVIECYLADPSRVQLSHDEFFDDIQRRFDALAIKALVETVESDLILSTGEAELAKTLVEHLLKQPVKSRHLKETFDTLSAIAKDYTWADVLQSLGCYEESREHFEEVKAAIVRISNIVAKVDGNVTHETVNQLKMIQWHLDQHLPSAGIGETPAEDSSKEAAGSQHHDVGELSAVLIQLIEQDQQASQITHESKDESNHQEDAAKEKKANEPLTAEQREVALAEGLAELDALIGMQAVRQEVRTLVNLCKLQQAQRAHGMPTNPLSLHMVFSGNPGTGKTTVARIVGKLFGAMGILQKGHLVETDRSGLVAEYQGQTAKKTNEKIDEALDGVLFIDEAYTLAPEGQPDSYGQEALATLLKRMEDDRDRLVVILAGYSGPMERLLKSNPGLSSRFSRHCEFPDYDAAELCQIFELLATTSHYQMTAEFREAVAAHIEEKVARKDEHFGNGRMVRNEFENAIRNLANRVVTATELTPDIVSTFHPADVGQSFAHA